MIMQEKIKVMKKTFRIRRIRFYSAKVTSIQKSPQITHRTHGDSSQSPYHTNTHGNPHGNPHTHGSPGKLMTAGRTQTLSENDVRDGEQWSIRYRGPPRGLVVFDSVWDVKPTKRIIVIIKELLSLSQYTCSNNRTNY